MAEFEQSEKSEWINTLTKNKIFVVKDLMKLGTFARIIFNGIPLGLLRFDGTFKRNVGEGTFKT